MKIMRQVKNSLNSIVVSKDEFLLLPLSNLFQTSIKFENIIEFEFSREKL